MVVLLALPTPMDAVARAALVAFVLAVAALVPVAVVDAPAVPLALA